MCIFWSQFLNCQLHALFLGAASVVCANESQGGGVEEIEGAILRWLGKERSEKGLAMGTVAMRGWAGERRGSRTEI